MNDQSTTRNLLEGASPDECTAEQSLAENYAFTQGLSPKFPTGTSPAKAIRRKCVDCMGGHIEEIARCEITNCALWPYRMGAIHFTAKLGGPFPARRPSI